jgi:hypothetical protein
MYLRTTKKRTSTGKVVESLQIVESVWDRQRKRSVVKVIYNCGSAHNPANRDKLKKLARGILRRLSPDEILVDNPGWRAVDSWPYGEIYVLEELWKRIGLPDLLPANTRDATRRLLPVERACFVMMANRCCAPSSKLYCFEQWLQEDVRIAGTGGLELSHLYRSMDYFEKNKEEIEKALFFRVADLFSVDVELVFYDTTTLHCEIDEEDADGQDDVVVQGSKLAGSKKYEALRQRSKSSKNKRSDLPQIVVGLAVTRDGLPIRSWVFRGDTVDVETVEKVKADLRGWRLTRSVFVGDAGMVSQENLKALAKGGGKYIVCVPMGRGDEVTKWVLAAPGRYKKVRENLRVKEVAAGSGERWRRYVVCFNPEEAQRQRQHRDTILYELKEMLPRLKKEDPKDQTHSKHVCQLRASKRYGQYLKFEKGRLKIDRDKVKQSKRLDGKFVVHSNDDSLTAEDMALGYKQLMEVERAWRSLKSGIKIRPMFHWVPHRICAHVSLTMLSLLLERIAENACGDTWRNIRDDLRQIKLVQLSTPNGEVWQVTEPSPAASNRLKQLGIRPPPPVLRVAI